MLGFIRREDEAKKSGKKNEENEWKGIVNVRIFFFYLASYDIKKIFLYEFNGS